jgi:hypothetical protein
MGLFQARIQLTVTGSVSGIMSDKNSAEAYWLWVSCPLQSMTVNSESTIEHRPDCNWLGLLSSVSAVADSGGDLRFLDCALCRMFLSTRLILRRFPDFLSELCLDSPSSGVLFTMDRFHVRLRGHIMVIDPHPIFPCIFCSSRKAMTGNLQTEVCKEGGRSIGTTVVRAEEWEMAARSRCTDRERVIEEGVGVPPLNCISLPFKGQPRS